MILYIHKFKVLIFIYVNILILSLESLIPNLIAHIIININLYNFNLFI